MKTCIPHLALASSFAFAALAPVPVSAQSRSTTVTEKRSSGGSTSSFSQSGGSSSGGSSGGGGFSGGSSGGNSFGSGGGTGFSSGGGGNNFNSRIEQRGRSSNRPIVVTSKPMEAKELAAAEEDLGIMARLLEKEIEREGGAGAFPNALGVALTQFDNRSPSVMLLEGYGAVFTFNTRLGLVPQPAGPRPSGKQPAPPNDSPWEQARREMFGGPRGGGDPGRPGAAPGMQPGFNPGPGFDMGMPFGPAEFDPKKVENLKKGLLETLRHAGNIRALKPDDYLTVVVQSAGSGFGHGQFGGGEFFSETRTTTSTSVNGEPPRVETRVSRDGGPAPGRAGTLNVRAKKADCEDFAKGKLTTDQFAKKALVTVQ